MMVGQKAHSTLSIIPSSTYPLWPISFGFQNNLI